MTPTLIDLPTLDGEQPVGLARLLSCGFPVEPTDVLTVELARARDPRLGRGAVALLANEPVGAVLARAPSGGQLFVVYLVVAAHHRRQGLARMLIDRLVAATEVDAIELLVDKDNRAAQRFYMHAGLRRCRDASDHQQTQRWTGRWAKRPSPVRPISPSLNMTEPREEQWTRPTSSWST
jgi:GNAT superfamily N-acetyltransferase